MSDLQIVTSGTGKFVPLTADQLPKLDQNQLAAYDEVAAAFAALGDADAEAATAKAQLSAAVDALAEAQRNEPKFDPEAVRIAELRAVIASNRAARGL
jgi:hypothetical protein